MGNDSSHAGASLAHQILGIGQDLQQANSQQQQSPASGAALQLQQAAIQQANALYHSLASQGGIVNQSYNPWKNALYTKEEVEMAIGELCIVQLALGGSVKHRIQSLSNNYISVQGFSTSVLPGSILEIPSIDKLRKTPLHKLAKGIS